MTKSELIEAVAAKLKLPKGKAELVVNSVFDTMVDSLQSGDGIEIRGFGSFTVRSYKAYEGRNPRTGATVQVQPKKLPFFKVGKDLRERVNQAFRNTPMGAASPVSAAPTGDREPGGTPTPPRPTDPSLP